MLLNLLYVLNYMQINKLNIDQKFKKARLHSLKQMKTARENINLVYVIIIYMILAFLISFISVACYT